MSNVSIYTNYYVCYFQVYELNEKTLLNSQNHAYIEELHRVTEFIKHINLCKFINTLDNTSIKHSTTIFSNYFIVTFSVSKNCFDINDFEHIRNYLIELMYQLAVNDIWAFGSVAMGQFYSSENINVGPAMVYAVETLYKSIQKKRGPWIYLHESITDNNTQYIKSIDDTKIKYIDWLYATLRENPDRIKEIETVIKHSSRKFFRGYETKNTEILQYYKITKRALVTEHE